MEKNTFWLTVGQVSMVEGRRPQKAQQEHRPEVSTEISFLISCGKKTYINYNKLRFKY